MNDKFRCQQQVQPYGRAEQAKKKKKNTAEKCSTGYSAASLASLEISRWEPGTICISKLRLVHGDLA